MIICEKTPDCKIFLSSRANLRMLDDHAQVMSKFSYKINVLADLLLENLNALFL